MDWKHERVIRRVLRDLARQRVVSVLQPGDVLLVERALPMNDDTAPALRTCHLRGWVEPIGPDAIPHGSANGLLTGADPLFDRTEVLWRLTDSGWNVIHDTHSWIVATFMVSFAALVASCIGIWMTLIH